jgi:TonB family protein
MMRYLRKELGAEQLEAADKHMAGCEFCREACDGMREFLVHKSPEALENTFSGLGEDLKTLIENTNVPPQNGNKLPGYKIFYLSMIVISIIVIICLYFLLLKKDTVNPVLKESHPEMNPPLPVQDTFKKSIQLAEKRILIKILTEKTDISNNQPHQNNKEEIDSTSDKSDKEGVVLDHPIPNEYPMELSNTEIFTVVEEQPQYPGGDQAQLKFLNENIKYPQAARDIGIQGKVFVTFVVETDGTISDVRVLRGIGGGCDEEAIRVVKTMPKWIPGRQRGIPVKVQFNLPVKFTLQ